MTDTRGPTILIYPTTDSDWKVTGFLVTVNNVDRFVKRDDLLPYLDGIYAGAKPDDLKPEPMKVEAQK